MPATKSDLERLLRPHGQAHLLAFWDRLSSDEQQRLAAQIEDIDFDQLARLYRGDEKAADFAALAQRAIGPPAFRLDQMRFRSKFTPAQARQRGQAALAAGKIGAILVAGGQGTRLGFDHPKGMFPIGPVSGATLFQILFEQLIAVGRRYGVRVPLYLMTSPATHEETIEYLAEHDRFGFPAEDLTIFCQGTMPALDAATGQVLLSAPGEVFASPDGHGGTLAALVKSGSLAAMHQRGLEQIFYFQVDNPLVRVCAPEFIGYHLLAGSEMSTQVVAKQFPAEKVGNVVAVDGQTRIIEYSDLPKEAGERRLPDGSLELWAGNIAVHVFDVAFLQRTSEDASALPFHVARKAVPYVNAAGEQVEPTSPNAIKFERFIFDLLPSAKQAIVMEVDAAEVFAPVKNAPGSERDSPETVQQQMTALHRKWLAAAGYKVDDVPVEISPLLALDADDVPRLPSVQMPISKPTYLRTKN